MSLDIIKKRFEEFKLNKLNGLNSFYRIKQDYEQIIHIIPKTGTFIENPYEYKNLKESSGLTIFCGKCILRSKNNKKYVSDNNDFKKYNYVALQDTCINSILEYSEKNKIDFFNLDYVQIKLKFYCSINQNNKYRKYYCHIFELFEIKHKDFCYNCK